MVVVPHEVVVEVADSRRSGSGKRLGFGERRVPEKRSFQPGVPEHGFLPLRQGFQNGGEKFPAETGILLQMMETVMKFSEPADEAALQNIDHILIPMKQRPQLSDVFQHGSRRGACRGRVQLVGETQQRLGAGFAQFPEKCFDVLQLFRRERTPVTIVHQETIALHNGHAVIGEIVQLVLPLRMGELHRVQPVAAYQARTAGQCLVLARRLEAAPVQLVLLAVTGAGSGGFTGNRAEIDLRAESPFRISQPHPAVRIIRTNAAEQFFPHPHSPFRHISTISSTFPVARPMEVSEAP